jgi:sporulation protein YlmC with PRC-barrel domain
MNQPVPTRSASRHLWLSTLGMAAALAALGQAQGQVVGSSTTVGATVAESTRMATGWSVKKSILGKTVYTERGEKIGKVEDLIIAPDSSFSFVIVGAGGFVGIGRHDVAIPIGQVHDRGGKIVITGSSKSTIKAMPAFNYADDGSQRAHFVAAVEQDIAMAQRNVGELEKTARSSSAQAKTKLDAEVAHVQVELKATEAKLADMQKAGTARWREFQVDLSAATAKLRASYTATVPS